VVQDLIQIIIELTSNAPPEKAEQLADLVRRMRSFEDTSKLATWSANPKAQETLNSLVKSARTGELSPLELAAMLTASSAAYHRAKAEQDVELVWTGPGSSLVATRKTEQALLQVIDAAESRLFMTSFVAYDVGSIMKALKSAVSRGVSVSMLLEAAQADGGAVSIDAISKMRSAMPSASIYTWKSKADAFVGGKVHAKVAVADEFLCFISSANLTGHAMEKNMEVGVLVRGGALPKQLHQHLQALVTTRVISV
jgi:cardiolipin synthase A/B